MKLAAVRLYLPLAIVFAAALGAAATYSSPASARRPEGPLEEAMEQMNGALRPMLKGVDASNRDKSLESVARFQSGLLAAKLLKPAKVEKPEDLIEFRKMLVDVLATSCKLESALLDSRFEEANATVKQLSQLKKQGHDKFQEDEE